MALGDLENVEPSNRSKNKTATDSNIDSPNNSIQHRYRSYKPHEKDKLLYELFDELEERFPEEVRCDFIEVSTRMDRCRAKAYYRDGGTHLFIRFSDWYVEKESRKELKDTMLHEMVHLWCFQKGFKKVSDGSPMFKWLCGQVGTKINQVPKSSHKWEILAEPFVEE